MLSLVFLIDVDNTLLDTDRYSADLSQHLDDAFGESERKRYWDIYGQLRASLGYADYLATLQLFRIGNNNELALLHMSSFLLDYPFNERFYPDAVAAIKHLNDLGTTVILSDGEMVFQPRKIQRSGIWDLVEGRVLLYLHKEQSLDSMQARFPAAHYVMIDDKPKLLAAMKKTMGGKLTTVFVRQGHYAHESFDPPISPAPDLVIERIGDLLTKQLSDFMLPAQDHK